MKFDRIVRDLKAPGSNIEENYVIYYLLLTMPSGYDAAIKTVSKNQLTLEIIVLNGLAGS